MQAQRPPIRPRRAAPIHPAGSQWIGGITERPEVMLAIGCGVLAALGVLVAMGAGAVTLISRGVANSRATATAEAIAFAQEEATRQAERGTEVAITAAWQATLDEYARQTEASRPTSTRIPTDSPDPTDTPTRDPAEEIEQAIIDFDREMRYLLETGDTSRMAQEATGEALSDRYEAANILASAGDCHWKYDHRSITILDIEWVSSHMVEVDASVDRDGQVLCSGIVQDLYTFWGPYNAIYVVELINAEWIVSNYDPVRD